MKIQYASDLHLEFADNMSFIEHGGIEPVGDVLVLAGDVSYLGDRKMWKRPFWDWCAEHFRETFVVPGNHEFYGGFDIGRSMADFELEVRPQCALSEQPERRAGGYGAFLYDALDQD